MLEPFPLQALADAGVAQQPHGGMLQDAGPDAVLDVVAAAGLEDDGVDAAPVEQMVQRQPGRPGTDDGHLCPSELHFCTLLDPCGSRKRRSSTTTPSTSRC